jgi:hypothetical protein
MLDRRDDQKPAADSRPEFVEEAVFDLVGPN